MDVCVRKRRVCVRHPIAGEARTSLTIVSHCLLLHHHHHHYHYHRHDDDHHHNCLHFWMSDFKHSVKISPHCYDFHHLHNFWIGNELPFPFRLFPEINSFFSDSKHPKGGCHDYGFLNYKSKSLSLWIRILGVNRFFSFVHLPKLVREGH